MAIRKKTAKKTSKKTAKKTTHKDKKTSKKAAKKTARATKPLVLDTDSSDDNISRYLNGKRLVPPQYRDSDEFLDIVSWNIRYFDHKDPLRVEHVCEVLGALNSDVFVLVEIAGDGVLDEVVERLSKKRAGFYSTVYGSTGAQQRVALMWDRDWVRAKEMPVELFGDENLTVPSEFGDGRQNVFPRLPLWGYFEALSPDPEDEGFTFELMGVHLKAQGPAPRGYGGPRKDRWGIPQRTRAATRIVDWLTDGNEHHDADILVVGDWNAATNEKEWKPIRDLEKQGDILFSNINPKGEPTHLVRLNKSGPAGSRLDAHLVTDEASAQAVPEGLGAVVKWNLFDNLDVLTSKERQTLFKGLKQRFSDHLPVLSRFYPGVSG